MICSAELSQVTNSFILYVFILYVCRVCSGLVVSQKVEFGV